MATDTDGRPKAASPPEGEVARRPSARSTVTLTGRGGVVIVFGLTLVGAVGGTLLGLRSAQGFLFLLGCLLAVLTTRRTDLLTLAVSPPLVFFLVSLLTAVPASLGERSFAISMMLTVTTTLTSNVPWLFLGTALVVLLALPRGLPGNLRDLSARVAADNPFRGRTSLLGRKDADEDPVRWDETPGADAGHTA